MAYAAELDPGQDGSAVAPVGIYMAYDGPAESASTATASQTGVAEAEVSGQVGIFLKMPEDMVAESTTTGTVGTTGVAEAEASGQVGIFLKAPDDMPNESISMGTTSSAGILEAETSSQVGIFLKSEEDSNDNVVVGGTGPEGVYEAESDANVGIWLGEASETFEDEDGDNSVEATTTLGIRLTAPDAYDVTFDPNATDADEFGWEGSDGKPTTSNKVDAGTTLGAALDSIPQPTRAGYVFGGWYKDSACSPDQKVTPDDATPIDEATTLYALWISKTSVDVPLNVYLTIQQNTGDSFTVSAAAPGKEESAYKLKNASPVPIQIESVTVQETNADNAKAVLGSNTLDGVKLHVMSTADRNEKAYVTGASDGTAKIYEMSVALDGDGVGTLRLNDPSKWDIYSLAIDSGVTVGNGYEGDGSLTVPAASFTMNGDASYDTRKGELDVFYGISGFDSSTLTYTGKRLPVAKLIYTIKVDGDSVVALPVDIKKQLQAND